MEVEAVREKVKAVPKLRFAEFNGAWSAGPLEDVLDLKSGYIFKSETYVEGGRYRVITIANVQDGRMSFERLSTVAELPDNIRDFQVLQQGDILISLTGNVGRVCLVEVDDCLLNQRVGKLVPKAQVDKDFLYQVLRNEEFLNAMVEQAQGGAQDNLSSKDVLGYEATLPTLPEQQKIAAFLGAVDRKIQQLKRKQALLEQYKKGVVQQLFNQQLRFKRKDGGEYPEWEEKRLGDVCEIAGGGTPDTDVPEYWNGDIQWFTPTEIKGKYVSKSKRTITKLGLQKSNAVLLPVGTILFTSRATIGEVSFAMEECATNQGFQSIIVNKHNSSEFVYQWILHHRELFMRKAQGSTFFELSKKEMAEIPIEVPSLEEQSRIAGFLMALDAKVAGVAQAVAAAQQWKKGLLQQMFV
ncbi:MAG: restriction endonuclease subunit S [Flavobacteriales bacterium]|nr:restriction endonuclease subunit S [Flavobacteriales bacterium]